MIALPVLALLVTGCAIADEEGGLPRDAPLPEQIPPGTELVVADQQEKLANLLRSSGELDRVPVPTEFANFTGGPEVLESMRAEATDIAVVGDTPPIHAQASGEDLPIVAATRVDDAATRFAVAPDSPVRELADLRGAKIAYAEGTAQQAIVLRALDRAGIGADEVELVHLQLAEFNDAVRTGAVDVAPLNEPRLSRFLQQTEGAGRLLPAEQTAGLSTGLTYLYARREALADPGKAAAIRAFVGHYVRAVRWADDHPGRWIEDYYVRSQGIGREDGRRIVESEGRAAFPRLDDALIATHQRTIDRLERDGGLPRRLDAEEHFDRRFDEVVAQAAREPVPARGGERGDR